MEFLKEWLFSGIVKAITSVNGAIVVALDSLLKTPEQYNSGIWSAINFLSETVVLPIAYVIFAGFMLMELYSLVVKYNSSGDMMYNDIFSFFMKFAFGQILMDNSFKLVSALIGVAHEIILKANAVMPTSSLDDMDLTQLQAKIETLKSMELIWLKIETMPLGAVLWGMSAVISILVIGRIIEMYVYAAIAPLPIATLMNAEWNSVSKSFLKSFAAVSLQGVFVVIIIYIYSSAINNIVVATDVQEALNSAIKTSGILVFCLFKSGGWAKSIMGS